MAVRAVTRHSSSGQNSVLLGAPKAFHSARHDSKRFFNRGRIPRATQPVRHHMHEHGARFVEPCLALCGHLQRTQEIII